MVRTFLRLRITLITPIIIPSMSPLTKIHRERAKKESIGKSLVHGNPTKPRVMKVKSPICPSLGANATVTDATTINGRLINTPLARPHLNGAQAGGS